MTKQWKQYFLLVRIQSVSMCVCHVPRVISACVHDVWYQTELNYCVFCFENPSSDWLLTLTSDHTGMCVKTKVSCRVLLSSIHQCVIIVKQTWVILLIQELWIHKFKNSDMCVCVFCVQSFTGDARRLWWVFVASFDSSSCLVWVLWSRGETLVFNILY